jgi:hypothetical protein
VGASTPVEQPVYGATRRFAGVRLYALGIDDPRLSHLFRLTSSGQKFAAKLLWRHKFARRDCVAHPDALCVVARPGSKKCEGSSGPAIAAGKMTVIY